MSHAKTAEPIEMLFALRTQMVPRNYVLDGSIKVVYCVTVCELCVVCCSDIFDAMFAMHRHGGEVIILQGWWSVDADVGGLR